MSQYQQYMYKIQHTPQVRINRPRFDHVVVIVHAIDLEEPREPEHRIATEVHLKQIEWQQRQQVQHERLGLEIMTGQFLAVVHHQSLLEVAGTKLHRHVQKEHKVRETVAGEPRGRRHRLQFRQALPHDQRPQIVQHATGQQHQPVIVKVLVWIHHGLRWFLRPPGPSPTTSARILVVGGVTFALARVQRLLTLRYLSGGKSLEKRVLAFQRRLLLDR